MTQSKKRKSTLERVTEPVAEVAGAIGHAIAEGAEAAREAGAKAVRAVTGGSKPKAKAKVTATAKKSAGKANLYAATMRRSGVGMS